MNDKDFKTLQKEKKEAMKPAVKKLLEILKPIFKAQIKEENNE